MMNFIRKYQKTFFWITLVGFLFATFAYFGAGGYLTHGYDTVATVNGKSVSYSEFSRTTSRAIEGEKEKRKGVELTDGDTHQIKMDVLRSMISEEAFYQIALKYGLTITDAEVMASIQQIPAFQKDGHFDHATYFHVLHYGLKMNFEEFEKSRNRALMVDRIKTLVFLLSKVTDKEAEAEYIRRNGNIKNYAKEKDKFIETLVNEKRTLIFSQWVTVLQQKTKIREFLSKFEQQQ